MSDPNSVPANANPMPSLPVPPAAPPAPAAAPVKGANMTDAMIDAGLKKTEANDAPPIAKPDADNKPADLPAVDPAAVDPATVDAVIAAAEATASVQPVKGLRMSSDPNEAMEAALANAPKKGFPMANPGQILGGVLNPQPAPAMPVVTDKTRAEMEAGRARVEARRKEYDRMRQVQAENAAGRLEGRAAPDVTDLSYAPQK